MRSGDECLKAGLWYDARCGAWLWMCRGWLFPARCPGCGGDGWWLRPGFLNSDVRPDPIRLLRPVAGPARGVFVGPGRPAGGWVGVGEDSFVWATGNWPEPTRRVRSEQSQPA